MNFKKMFACVVMFIFIFAEIVFARGGSFSGGRSSFGGGRSFSSPSRSFSSPSKSYSSPSKSFSSPSRSASGSKSSFGATPSSSSKSSGSNWAYTPSTGSKTTYKATTIPSYGNKKPYKQSYKLPSDFRAPARNNYHYYGGNDGFMNFMTTYMLISAMSQNNNRSDADKLEIARLKAELAKDPKYQENMAMLAKEKAFEEEQKKNESNCFINTLN